MCEQNKAENRLTTEKYCFEGTNALFILDDFGASKDVRGHTSQLISLAFSARHSGIILWVLTQQITSIAKPFWRRSYFFTPP